MKEKINMKTLIELIDNDELVLYMGNGVDMDADAEKRIVLFTHELKRSGAPSVLFDMSKVLLEQGYTVFLVAYEDGELLEEFVALGVNVILYTNMSDDANWLVTIAKVFPIVLINTMPLMYLVNFLAPFAKSLYWWIHEADIAIHSWKSRSKELPKVPSLKILAASPLIQKNLKEYWNCDSELLNFYIEDVPAKCIERGEKLNIINIGDVNGNKGQDILVKAFDKLDEETKAKCDLYFCGENQRFNEKILLEVLDYVDANENVHMLEGMPKSDLYEVYDEVDIVVVASYYESTSAVAVEGLMKERLCICTETCGVCEYLKDGENVLTFKRGDADSLKEALDKAINQYAHLSDLRKNGRKVFENVYSKEIFEQRLIELLEGGIKINQEMNQCTGCGACMAACPVGAISMERNEKGFLYPSIDEAKCIKCKKCVVSCPVNSLPVNEASEKAYALKRKDKDKLKESQSGGAFSVFAEEVLRQGGVVYGVALDEKCNASYIRVDNEDDLIRLKGSKYVQADLKDTYTMIKEDIKDKKVLFGGTPCYVAGLKKYLQNEDTGNLITCDLVCHGVPSPKVYESHLEYLGKRFDREINDFNFRDKSYNGWHTHVETWTDKAGRRVVENSYANIFYTDACLRESCYSCNYANTKRPADITVADFWGIENVFPDMDDNTGVSLVLVNSDKGSQIFAKIIENGEVEIRETETRKCLQRNLQIPTPRPSSTEEFWHDYFNYDYRKIVRKYGQINFYNRANFSVLNCWQNKLDRGESLASKLLERKISRIIVMGDRKNNELAIMELKKANCFVMGEIQYKDEGVSEKVPTIPLDENLVKLLEKADTILVTNESDMVDILTELYKVKVPMEKITPISFVVDEEV